jgi:hypothetical protein
MTFAEGAHGWVRMIVFGGFPFARIENPFSRDTIGRKPISKQTVLRHIGNLCDIVQAKIAGRLQIYVLIIGM